MNYLHSIGWNDHVDYYTLIFLFIWWTIKKFVLWQNLDRGQSHMKIIFTAKLCPPQWHKIILNWYNPDNRGIFRKWRTISSIYEQFGQCKILLFLFALPVNETERKNSFYSKLSTIILNYHKNVWGWGSNQVIEY